MPKSLGQIHTVNYENLGPIESDTEYLIDLAGELTKQLQHMVRAMSAFKLVGMDFALSQPTGSPDPVSCTVTGNVAFYAPTQGRVTALQMAYKSVRRMMKLSGVKPSDNITYDFRPPIADPASFENGADFYNQASIEDNGLATCLANGPGGSSNIFGIYNQGINPRSALGGVTGFEEGFDIGLRSNAASADWALNEGVILQALTAPIASEEFEEIPFDLALSSMTPHPAPTPTQAVPVADTWMWRPDPALYLSILTGQLKLVLDEVDIVAGETDEVTLDCAFHVAGWKSILGSKKRKRRRSKKRRYSKKKS